ncbi:MAG: bifunctional methylenetetrahydrofolate dehydrogenase/methenyltetrahydrofolate cyclohydrolase [Polyangiaceae bacterium]
MTARILDPSKLAAAYREEVRRDIAALGRPVVLVGLLVADHGPSMTYADYTRIGCEDVGVRFDLRHRRKLEIEPAIHEANGDPSVDGIIVYYPVFGTERDPWLRDAVEPGKDIEGLHSYWSRCLYANKRWVDEARTAKAILPCTPLAILKLLGAARPEPAPEARPFEGQRVVIFNRSEVVGRPLATMMANDGAEVASFDLDGAQMFTPSARGATVAESSITRAEALRSADIVITGVPSATFDLVRAAELRPGAICLNFSTRKNFHEDALEAASVFIPRVGPMTVAMALRNTVRLSRSDVRPRP